MYILEIILKTRLIAAFSVYTLLIVFGLFLLDYLHNKLNHHLLVSMWEIVIEPLYRSFVLVIFIIISYPLLFGLEHATPITILVSENEQRLDQLVNLAFLTSLLLPLIPVVGRFMEIILPMQAILCCMMIFNWLAQSMYFTDFTYWPGSRIILLIILLALFTHWLSVLLARQSGSWLDNRFNVIGFEDLIGESIILFMQAPVILVYSVSLGRQLS